MKKFLSFLLKIVVVIVLLFGVNSIIDTMFGKDDMPAGKDNYYGYTDYGYSDYHENETDYGHHKDDHSYPDKEYNAIDPDGSYFSKEDVALYIHTYGCLPKNFITKDEAREKGWEGGNVEEYAPGCAIGGDRFGNREGQLPKGHTYYECDIDTDGYHSRGSRRIVFSDDGLIYYTHDHYETFELLYGEE